MEQTYFQRGFSLKQAVAPVLAQSYDSATVDRLKQLGYLARAGEISFRLAREFGFCYGVERAVDYAYQARERFPDRRIFLSGEIIHNPDVNRRIEDLGIRILSGQSDPESRYAEVKEADVVILPAFGVATPEMEHLRARGCILVDTTCGSVLNVWKNVRRFAREGFTAVIHGKHFHEETRATASQALTQPGGQYLCVRNAEEASAVCDFIRGATSAEALLERFRHAASPALYGGIGLLKSHCFLGDSYGWAYLPLNFVWSQAVNWMRSICSRKSPLTASQEADRPAPSPCRYSSANSSRSRAGSALTAACARARASRSAFACARFSASARFFASASCLACAFRSASNADGPSSAPLSNTVRR